MDETPIRNRASLEGKPPVRPATSAPHPGPWRVLMALLVAMTGIWPRRPRPPATASTDPKAPVDGADGRAADP
jgi:hypothetical protein